MSGPVSMPPVSSPGGLTSADDVRDRFDAHDYLADPGTATAVFLSLQLGLPLLLEGEPGVGKTAAAKVLAQVLDVPLIRLQCYEGLSVGEALYDWNYQRQLLAIRLAEASHEKLSEADLFTEEFLLERPILACVRHTGPRPPVLLIDEIDRADEEFEAYLLEILSDFSVTVPELGTIAAAEPPAVVVTSNRTRELHDALKRRCLYHWIDHPDLDREVAIVRTRAPQVGAALARDVAGAVERLRALDLAKVPGVAETIDWANALAFLGAERLDAAIAGDTLGAVVKDHEDQALVAPRLAEVVGEDA